MKSILLSIKPKYVELIASGQKTIEVRKTAPKEVPFKCYIYCCKAKPYLYKEANPPFELFLDSDLYEGEGYDDRLFSGKVIGEFICDEIIEWQYDKGHQYYVEYPENGATYKIWLEEERSIEEKVKTVTAGGISNVSFWKLGLENSETWNAVGKYINAVKND